MSGRLDRIVMPRQGEGRSPPIPGQETGRRDAGSRHKVHVRRDGHGVALYDSKHNARYALVS
uniref:Uncharacterized protein n=1 Tax=Leersia perrieri TaxID=77586 RepID=A0A0D9X5Y9_9ORYZ